MNYTEQQLTAAIVSSGLRPALAEIGLHLPKTLLSLIEKCWEADPSKRPSMDSVVVELESIWGQERGKQQGHLHEKTFNSQSYTDGDTTKNSGDYRDTINWYSQGECLSKKSSGSRVFDVKLWSNSTDDPSRYVPIISCGSFATCGRRESMEDTHFLMPHMCSEESIHLFAIFDGHQGAAAAEFSAQVFPGLVQSFCSTRHILQPALMKEIVIGEGRRIEWLVDTWRVAPAGLQVTRSIGDADLKPAVTAEPEISETILSAEDEYLVMASDGLWDVLNDKDVIGIIRDTVKEPSMCSKRLATEAAARGSADNITVIVVFLRPVSTAERIY